MTNKQLWRSPALVVLLLVTCVLVLLLLVGLNYGPLHTDVIIQRAWFKEVGVTGFPDRMFASNQRHFLYGSLFALLHQLFGEQDLPYNLIFHGARLLQGVLLAGLVQALTGRSLLAVCAGLALSFTPIRVHELFQEVNWFIEPTLTLLLASSLSYALSVRSAKRRWRIAWYSLSIVSYIFSILIYESGLPWLAVNVVLGYLLREGQPLWQRVRQSLLDVLPSLAAALVITYLLLVQFNPWSGLLPNTGSGLLERLVQQLLTPITFVSAYVDEWLTTRDYYGLILLCVVATAAVIWVLWRWWKQPTVQETISPLHDYTKLALLGITMVVAGTLVGASSQLYIDYLDRVTFARSVGITLLWVTLIFVLGGVTRRTWLAPLLTALVLIGPGLGWLLANQQYAQRTRADIPRLAATLLAAGKVIYPPAYAVIIMPPAWAGARFLDASDVVLLEVQQHLFDAGSPLRIDLLKTWAFPESYATMPGSCETIWGEASSGICLADEHIVASRWVPERSQPNDNVIVMQFDDESGKVTIIQQVSIAELLSAGYNITTASGQAQLITNAERVAVPLPYTP